MICSKKLRWVVIAMVFSIFIVLQHATALSPQEQEKEDILKKFSRCKYLIESWYGTDPNGAENFKKSFLIGTTKIMESTYIKAQKKVASFDDAKAKVAFIENRKEKFDSLDNTDAKTVFLKEILGEAEAILGSIDDEDAKMAFIIDAKAKLALISKEVSKVAFITEINQITKVTDKAKEKAAFIDEAREKLDSINDLNEKAAFITKTLDKIAKEAASINDDNERAAFLDEVKLKAASFDDANTKVDIINKTRELLDLIKKEKENEESMILLLSTSILELKNCIKENTVYYIRQLLNKATLQLNSKETEKDHVAFIRMILNLANSEAASIDDADQRKNIFAKLKEIEIMNDEASAKLDSVDNENDVKADIAKIGTIINEFKEELDSKIVHDDAVLAKIIAIVDNTKEKLSSINDSKGYSDLIRDGLEDIKEDLEPSENNEADLDLFDGVRYKAVLIIQELVDIKEIMENSDEANHQLLDYEQIRVNDNNDLLGYYQGLFNDTIKKLDFRGIFDKHEFCLNVFHGYDLSCPATMTLFSLPHEKFSGSEEVIKEQKLENFKYLYFNNSLEETHESVVYKNLGPPKVDPITNRVPTRNVAFIKTYIKRLAQVFIDIDSKSVTSIFMTSDQYCESQYPTVDFYGNF